MSIAIAIEDISAEPNSWAAWRRLDSIVYNAHASRLWLLCCWKVSYQSFMHRYTLKPPKKGLPLASGFNVTVGTYLDRYRQFGPWVWLGLCRWLKSPTLSPACYQLVHFCHARLTSGALSCFELHDSKQSYWTPMPDERDTQHGPARGCCQWSLIETESWVTFVRSVHFLPDLVHRVGNNSAGEHKDTSAPNQRVTAVNEPWSMIFTYDWECCSYINSTKCHSTLNFCWISDNGLA